METTLPVKAAQYNVICSRKKDTKLTHAVHTMHAQVLPHDWFAC